MKLGASGQKFQVADKIALTEAQILTLTLWGEARGEPIEGRIAIACLIRNRKVVGRWGNTYAKVCLAPWQFSCWRREGGADNYLRVIAMADALSSGETIPDEILRECGWIAHGLIDAWLRDNSFGATHYYAPEAMVPPGKVPSWALGLSPCASYGGHLFFRGVK